MNKLLLILIFSLSITFVFSQKMDTLEFVRVYKKVNENSSYIFQQDTFVIGNSFLKKKFVKEKDAPAKLLQIEYFTKNLRDSLISFHQKKRIMVEKYINKNLSIINFWETDTNYRRIRLLKSRFLKRQFDCGSKLRYSETSPPYDFIGRLCPNKKKRSFKIVYYCNGRKVFKYTNGKKLFRPYLIVKKEYREINSNNNVKKTKSVQKIRNKKTIVDETFYYYNNDVLVEKLTKSKNLYKEEKITYFYNDNGMLVREHFVSPKTKKDIQNIYYEYGSNGLIKEIKTISLKNLEKTMIVMNITTFSYSENNKLLMKLVKRYNIYQNHFEYIKEEYK